MSVVQVLIILTSRSGVWLAILFSQHGLILSSDDTWTWTSKVSTDLTNPLFPPGADDAGDMTSLYLVMGDTLSSILPPGQELMMAEIWRVYIWWWVTWGLMVHIITLMVDDHQPIRTCGGKPVTNQRPVFPHTCAPHYQGERDNEGQTRGSHQDNGGF